MSIQAVTYVLDSSPSRGACRLVLISLANHANKHGGSCFPSLEMVADGAGVGRTTAWRSIEKLEQEGEILVRRSIGRGHRSEYVLVMGRDAEACQVLFDDAEAEVEGDAPQRRGRPKKVPQRNNNSAAKAAKKVPQRNISVPLMMEHLEGFVNVPLGDVKGSTAEQKCSAPSRAPTSDCLTVSNLKEPSSSSSVKLPEKNDDDDDEFSSYQTALGKHWSVALEMFEPLFPALKPRRVAAMLGAIEQDVGPLTKEQLQEGLDDAFDVLKSLSGTVTHQRPYVQRVVTDRLMEIRNGHH